MKMVPAIQVSDGNQFRLMTINPNLPVLDLGAHQSVIEAMLQKYLDKDEDLSPMECFHFQNWALQFVNRKFKKSRFTVQVGEVEAV